MKKSRRTVYENVDLFQNPGKTDTNGEFNVGVGETLEAVKVKKDYLSFPALAGPPRIGDKIAYRVS